MGSRRDDKKGSTLNDFSTCHTFELLYLFCSEKKKILISSD